MFAGKKSAQTTTAAITQTESDDEVFIGSFEIDVPPQIPIHPGNGDRSGRPEGGRLLLFPLRPRNPGIGMVVLAGYTNDRRRAPADH